MTEKSRRELLKEIAAERIFKQEFDHYGEIPPIRLDPKGSVELVFQVLELAGVDLETNPKSKPKPPIVCV